MDRVDAAIAFLTPTALPPTDQPWGERLAHLADPDGAPVHVCARIVSG